MRHLSAAAQQFFQISPDLHCIIDADGRFSVHNPAWLGVLGFSETELKALTLFSLVHPDDRSLIRDLLSTGESLINFQSRCITREGTYKVFSWKAIASEGAYYAIGRDITEAKKHEEQLQRSQKFLDSIIENIPNMIFIKDAKDLNFIHFNRAGEDLIGFPRDAFIGKNDYDFFTKEQADFFTQKDREVIRSGKIADIPEEPIQTKDKGTRILHTKKLGMTAPDGSQYLIGIAEDITEKKGIEDALRQSEERFRTIYENAPIMIDAFDSEGKCILWNKACEETLGYSKAEISGRTDTLEIFYPDERVRREVLASIQTPDGKFREFKVRRRDGQDVYQLWANFALPKNGVISIGIDINERKLAEQELVRARLIAEEATKIKSEFLANMSHEIRTPINGVIGMIGILLDTQLSEEQRDYAETVKRSADTLLTVINDILDFSKVEAGKLEFEEDDFDLARVVLDAVQTLSFASREKNIRLIVDAPSSYPTQFRGDAGRIQQILTNLLSNAIKFTFEGTVTLRVKTEIGQSGQQLRVEVEDTGIGIPTEALDRLFKAFSQADSTTSRRFGGTGLGLSICKRLVELMGGEIGVKSTAGKGSTFWFTLPLTAAERKSALVAPTSEADPAVSLIDGKHILIAEDNLINQKVALKQMEKLGYHASVVSNGVEALEALNHAAFDLILMDCQMPEMDGFQATRMIREGKTANSAQIPIVAMTANAMTGDREKCIAAGMDGYVSKPVKLDELDRIVKICLAKRFSPRFVA